MSVATVAQSSSQSQSQESRSSSTSTSASGVMGTAQLMGMDYDAGAAALMPGNTDYYSQVAALAPDGMGAGAMGVAPAPEPATLADVMGGDYEGDRDFFTDQYWEARCSIDPLLDEVRGVDAGAATVIDGQILDSEDALDAIGSLEAELLQTARWEGEELFYDEVLADELELALLDLQTYTRLLSAHASLWSLVLALPWLDGFSVLLAGWVQVLETLDQAAKAMHASYVVAQEIYDAHRAEFEQACMKIGLDVALITAGLAVGALATGPIAIAAGVGVALAGVGGALLIEGRVGQAGKMKTALNAANVTRAIAEAHEEGLSGLSVELTKNAKYLGPAMNALSLIADSAEAVIEKGVVDQALAQMRDLDAKYGELFKIWPSVVTALEVAGPQLADLEHALNEVGPRMDALQADIRQLEGELAGR